MKSLSSVGVLSLLSLALVSCDPPASSNNSAEEENRREIEKNQAAYAQQAADMQARSENLQQQLADLQQSIRDKENADLQARLAAIQQENEKLLADAEAARRKSDELRDQLASIPQPGTAPYTPPAPAGGSQPWIEPDADYSVFYEELEPYGKWLDVEGYGYAWQPALAARSTWRPYTDGRWVWSDQGWAWDTPEPFGWACYHYGRWVRMARQGWVWVPGRDWAPAWVSWRSGGDCVGWAPLPPERRRGYTSIGHDCDVSYDLAPSSYVFIQAGDFGRGSYLNVCLPLANATRIFQQTVNLTSLARVNQGQTQFFVNRGGPDRRWLEQRIGGRIPEAPVRIARSLERPQRDREDRGSIRQLIAAPLPADRPGRPHTRPQTADKIAKPALVDAWAEVPADRRKTLRDMVSRQAQDPKPPRAADTAVSGGQPPTPGQVPDRDRDRGNDRDRPGQGRPRPEDAQAEVRPGIPSPGRPGGTPSLPLPDRPNDRDLPRERPPGGMKPGSRGEDTRTRDDLARHEAQRLKQKEEALRQAGAAKTREDLARKQAEDAAMGKQKEDLLRQQAEAMQAREAQAQAQAAQQAEMQRRQQEAETARLREAAMAQQQEAARQAQETAAMQRRQQEAQQAEMLQRQREAMAEKAREAAARQQQENAERQRQAGRQQQEMAERQRAASDDAQRRAQEAQRRAQDDNRRRDDESRRQR